MRAVGAGGACLDFFLRHIIPFLSLGDGSIKTKILSSRVF